MFKKIVREDDVVLFKKQTEKYFNCTNFKSHLGIIKDLYKALQKEYRCEYIYKNNLVLNIIKEHSLKTTLILNELKIGASKADLVMLNGAVKVFEIKTELDGFGKLSKQLNDYQKFADKVYIVTDEKFAEKLYNKYKATNIGIIVFDTKNKFITIKEAYENSTLFDFDTIFKILRKQEYMDLVYENYGFIPDVPNTKVFRTCYELLKSKNIVDFQKQVLNKLKNRKLQKPDLLKSSSTPKELKHICNSLDFNEQEYHKLYNFLATR
uniref:sce7726 family protein n=1 Tax=Flavobacterium sp. TaxID=239 RepID=UPI0040497D78